jgi:hypothetical protein
LPPYPAGHGSAIFPGTAKRQHRDIIMFALVFMLDWSGSWKNANFARRRAMSTGTGDRETRRAPAPRKKGVGMATKSPAQPTGRVYFPDELRLLREIFDNCTAGRADREKVAGIVAKRLMDAYENGIRDEKLLRLIAVGNRASLATRPATTVHHHL